MERYDWGRLSHLQVGRYAEYLAKMEFALYGFDVYTAEVDDKGIDFVVRSPAEHFHEMQVKAVRWPKSNYVFLPKTQFTPKATLHLVLLLLRQSQPPAVYLIPSVTWLDTEGPACFVHHEYGGGLKSKPEYGLNISHKALETLEHYRFDRQIDKLR